ncbi:MAG: PAS domain S-box protein, partial [Verrucomicrobia bacterium]
MAMQKTGEHARVRELEAEVERLKGENERLRADAARLRLVVEQIPAVLWTVDRDLRFTSSMGLGLRRLGLEPNAVVGRSLAEFFQTDDPDFHQLRNHRRALRGESVAYYSEWAGRVYQTYIEPLREDGKEPVGVIGVAYDVTERVVVERELRASQTRLRLATEAAELGIWDFDPVNNRLYWDDRMFDIFKV